MPKKDMFMKNDELKLCPFCGVPVAQIDYDSRFPKSFIRYSVYCYHKNGCPLDGEPCGSYKTKDEAKAAWNQRF